MKFTEYSENIKRLLSQIEEHYEGEDLGVADCDELLTVYLSEDGWYDAELVKEGIPH